MQIFLTAAFRDAVVHKRPKSGLEMWGVSTALKGHQSNKPDQFWMTDYSFRTRSLIFLSSVRYYEKTLRSMFQFLNFASELSPLYFM